MMNVFISESSRAVAQLKDASVAGDLAAIKRTCHRIKPSIRGIPIVSVLEDIDYLEALDESLPHNGELTGRVSKIEDVLNIVNEQFRFLIEKE